LLGAHLLARAFTLKESLAEERTRVLMISSEVQRTLVKSPPELWAELSDPTTLARHLGELGEIRIVAIEPERTVDWEAAAADGAEVSGRVELQPSAWGTRVTLSASRAIVESADEAEADPEATIEAETDLVAEPALDPSVEPAAQSPPSPELAVEAQPELEPPIVEEPEPEIIEPAPRPRFFARLFRRHRKEKSLQPESATEPEAAVEPEPVAAVEIEKPAPEEIAPAVEALSQDTAPEEPASAAETAPGEPASEQEEPTPETNISAELAELEEQTTAVLTGVLDRLGAAHHRPFSRA
jgi:hypothetical protein